MAQIWMTYEEIASVFGVTCEDARRSAIANGWGRMKDRFGGKYVRLSPSLADEYITYITKKRSFAGTESILLEARNMPS